MTEKSFKKMGFSFVEEYTLGQCHTVVYRKGCLEVDVDYESGKKIGCELRIFDGETRNPRPRDVKLLDKLFNSFNF